MRLSEAGEEKFNMRTRSEETAGMSYREVVDIIRQRPRGRGRVEEMGKKGEKLAVMGGDRTLHSA